MSISECELSEAVIEAEGYDFASHEAGYARAKKEMEEQIEALEKQNAALLKAAKSAKAYLARPEHLSDPAAGEMTEREIIQQLEQAIAKDRGETND